MKKQKPIILLSGDRAGGKTHIANAIKQQFDDELVVTLTLSEFYSIQKQPNLFRHIRVVDIHEISCGTPEAMEVLFDSIGDLINDVSNDYEKPICFIIQSQIFYRKSHDLVTEVECHYVRPSSNI